MRPLKEVLNVGESSGNFAIKYYYSSLQFAIAFLFALILSLDKCNILVEFELRNEDT